MKKYIAHPAIVFQIPEVQAEIGGYKFANPIPVTQGSFQLIKISSLKPGGQATVWKGRIQEAGWDGGSFVVVKTYTNYIPPWHYKADPVYLNPSKVRKVCEDEFAILGKLDSKNVVKAYFVFEECKSAGNHLVPAVWE